MENPEKNKDIFDKIKIFSSEDEKLKLLGELLSNKSSRDIIKLLIDKEMYTNEIVKKLELKVSLVIHHLQKMQSIGLLEITNKKITRNGENHRFFRIPTGMLILPNESKEIIDNRFFKGIFKTGMKFVAIGIAAISTWVGTTINSNKILVQRGSSDISSNEIEEALLEIIYDIEFFTFPLIITSIVIGSGLFLIWFSKKEKRIRGLSH